jgi:hypothetical protein
MVIVERAFMDKPPVTKVACGLRTDFPDELFAANP